MDTILDDTPPRSPAPPGSSPPSVDPDRFRHALSQFLTGVTIVTLAGVDGEPVGMTANAFTSVSLDPPLVMLCVARSARTFAALDQASRYAVHILHTGQHTASTAFARSAAGGGPGKFDGVDWHLTDGGLPVLDDCLARLDCTIAERISLGDHVGFLGRVDAADVAAIGDRPPLGFFRGGYANLAG